MSTASPLPILTEDSALAGDTVQFVVWRGSQRLTLTVVLGRWDPAEETPGIERSSLSVA